VRRFQQEAKTAAKLDHPNIIPIYRVESEGGLNYFVMKYISAPPRGSTRQEGAAPRTGDPAGSLEAACAWGTPISAAWCTAT